MKKILNTVLMILVLVPLITGDVEAAIKVIKISGKLTKINRDVKIAAGPGHAVAVWNQSSSKSKTFGKIFANELKRNKDGSYNPIGEPFVVFAQGQRPQIVYLPNLGQYIMVCDTGPKDPWDPATDKKPSKILARTYIPSSTTDDIDMALGLGPVTTILDDGTQSLYPFIKHIGFNQGQAFEEVLLFAPQTILKTANNGSIPGVSNTEEYRTKGMRIDVFKNIMYHTPALFILTGFMIFSYVLFVNPNTLISSFLQITSSNTQYFIHSSLLLLNIVSWTYFVVLTLANPILFSFLIAVAIAPLFPRTRQFLNPDFEKASSLTGAAIHNITDKGEPEVVSFKADGGIKTKKNFGPIWKTAGKEIDYWRMLAFNSEDSSPAAKLSATYIIFHATDGFVRHRGLTLTGKPTGKVSKDFKVKKKLFGGMDTDAFEDEVLLVYVEYTSKKLKKSVIKFANFKIN